MAETLALAVSITRLMTAGFSRPSEMRELRNLHAHDVHVCTDLKKLGADVLRSLRALV